MSKHDELGRAKSLLSQAMSVALNSMPNNSSVTEARQHMKQAINKLDKAQKSQLRKRELTGQQFENWWGNVQSGTSAVAAQPMAEHAQVAALGNLNSMIEEEKNKLAELEKSDQNQPGPSKPDQLLSD